MKRLILLITMLTSSIAAAAEGGFLFVTFKGEANPMTEQIYFATSRDGRAWEALNGGEPVLVSELGEKGVRDPYLVRSKDGKKAYLLATDLSIARNNSWTRAAQRGSKSIVIWESSDLVTWSAPRLAKIAPDTAGCTWAPEAVYDEEADDYLVFWASTTSDNNFANHLVWACRTKDFVTFGKPFVYIDQPPHVIDTDIVRENGKYYRFTKDEKTKDTIFEVSEKLTGPWQVVPGNSLAKLRGYEGPQCFRLAPGAEGKRGTWCLLLDHYTRGAGYKAFVTHDLAGGQFEPMGDSKFPFRFRHGSVLPVSAEELARLTATYGGAAKPAK